MTRLLSISLLLAACGGGAPSGIATVDSTVQGLVPPATLPAISSSIAVQCQGQISYASSLVFGGSDSSCTPLAPASGPYQSLEIQTTISSAPLTAGKYSIGLTGSALVTAEVSDGTNRRFWKATAGTLTIDAVDGDAMFGSFEASGIVETTTNPAGQPAEGTLTGRFFGTGCHAPLVVCL
jgi:hypothetical protein